MLLSYNRLCALIDAGAIVHADYSAVNSASIDIRLGSKVLVEHCCDKDGNKLLHRVSLRKKEALKMREYDLIKDGPLLLFPGEFILAHSFEIFNLPNNISAEFLLKSTPARMALEHLHAGWCDAGWHGSVLTLELKNVSRGHEIEISYQDWIGQLVFFQHDPVPADKSYATRGRYNQDKSVSGAKLDPSRIVFGEEGQDEAAAEYAATHPEAPVTLEFSIPYVEDSKKKLVVDDQEGEIK